MEVGIRDLVEEYAAAVARRDFDAAVGLFTVDARRGDAHGHGAGA
jgi:ketosteroid isomerase-like protein